jgi:DNA replication protein DnaC
VLALGNSGTGKTHIALALGLAACQKGYRVRFATAAGLVHELIEARDEKRLLRIQKQLATYQLLIIDELGFVPLSRTGAQLLFEIFSHRYERGATLVTSNLPFNEWTEILGTERLTGALLDRLTHHIHILEMNGDSYRLKEPEPFIVVFDTITLMLLSRLFIRFGHIPRLLIREVADVLMTDNSK